MVSAQGFSTRQAGYAFRNYLCHKIKRTGIFVETIKVIFYTPMETTSLSELKKELTTLLPKDVVEICMKLVRYKKENKELLDYLLFHAHNEQAYIESVKKEITFLLRDSTLFTLRLSKKTIRSVLKTTNKYIKYSKLKQTEVELRIHFCSELKRSVILKHADRSIENLYDRQIQKIKQALEKLHEDLQHDYLEELKTLS
jgi:hypothetical protein